MDVVKAVLRADLRVSCSAEKRGYEWADSWAD
jgi:hypothetical protein